jgi:hypothetical protein
METQTLKPGVLEIGMFDIILFCLNCASWLIHKQYPNNTT